MAELVSSVARERERKRGDYIAPVPVERGDEEQTMRAAATVPFPGTDGTTSSSSSSLHRSGISVRLVGDNACSIDTRSRGKLRSERRRRRRRADMEGSVARANGSLLARRLEFAEKRERRVSGRVVPIAMFY